MCDVAGCILLGTFTAASEEGGANSLRRVDDADQCCTCKVATCILFEAFTTASEEGAGIQRGSTESLGFRVYPKGFVLRARP